MQTWSTDRKQAEGGTSWILAVREHEPDAFGVAPRVQLSGGQRSPAGAAHSAGVDLQSRACRDS